MATGKKTGGRTKGTPNTNTKELREKFTLLVESNFDKLQTDIDLLEPKDRVKTLLELSRFIVPTLKAIELTTDTISLKEDYSNYSTEDLEALEKISEKYYTKKDV